MRRLSLFLLVLLLTLGAARVAGQTGLNYQGMVPAPEFPTGVDWLNVPGPLTLEGLRGKIVMLDFWTYGCINCIHMIPVLEQLSQKYAEELVIISVHSAKFENEGRLDNLRQVVQRYEIGHPVVNDPDFAVWGAYMRFGVNAWPTFVLIDPRGNLVAVQAGEVRFEVFDQVLSGMIAHWDAQGDLERGPLELALESASRPNTALAFPGKVLVDARANRLFIADSTHNRIIIADLLTYEVLDVIGSGARGLNDGAFAEATFNKPQGMALVGDTLYIADTKNHAIRAADLTGRTVDLIAGTGQQSRGRGAGGPALGTAIASPWDLAFDGEDRLYIAMAGPHQIWALDLDEGAIYALVGSGREGLVDGAFPLAELAQPSGLYLRDGLLYFADSESSSVRAADVGSGEVFTLAGPLRNDLFTYGDVDGPVGESRLQHALDVTGGADGLLYVADTYNHKIKVIDPAARETRTLFGADLPTGGFRDGGADAAAFDEPGGIAWHDGLLYVADTNNHAIRVIDLAAGVVSTVTFPNPEALQIGDRPTVVGGNAPQAQTITLPGQTVADGAGEIVLDVRLPDGYKLNDLAPFTAEWAVEGEAVALADADRALRLPAPAMPLRIPASLSAGEATLRADLTIYYCEAVNETLCFVEQVTMVAPVAVSAAGDVSALVIEHTVTPPDLTGADGF